MNGYCITRRRALLSALAVPPSLLGLGGGWDAFAGEFWQEKAPSDWSEAEVQRPLTRSPWARAAAARLLRRGSGRPRDATAREPALAPLVRWESALPVRHARRRPLAVDHEGHHVLGVTGLGEMPSAERDATELRVGRSALLHPARIQLSDDGKGVLFSFPRRDSPITTADREIVFRTRTPACELTAVFALDEMVLRGRLEL
jgi:hypothetical protein